MTPTAVRITALAVGVAALVAWAFVALAAPRPALQGWLVGFVFVSSLSLGSLAAVLIRRLVGGRWGRAFAPELEAAARVTPLTALFALPVLLGAGLIFPWAAEPSALKPGVHALYLNLPFFIVRSLVALGGWSAIALLLPRIEGPRGRLWAGLALVFHGIAVTVMSIDWILSTLPSWTSSDIGMDFATQQLAAGFAFAALQSRARVDDPAAGDLAGLMFATVIGLTYLEFMSYLVVWYGDKPSLDLWYVPRVRWPWENLPWLSLACGVAAIVLLAGRRALGTHRAVAWVGGCVLAGVLAYQLWLVAPNLGAGTLGPALLALVGQGGVWLAAVGGLPRLGRRSQGLAHAV